MLHTLRTMVNPLTEQAIVIFGIQQDDGLGVDVQLRPSNNLHKFFHSTESTRQCDKGVTLMSNWLR